MKRRLMRWMVGTIFPVAAVAAGAALAATQVDIHAIDQTGVGNRLGTVTAAESAEGLVLTVKLREIPPGEHGFHVHQHGDCGPKAQDGAMVAGLAAGGHYDPEGAGRHEGPQGKGHRGDLPALHADAGGNVDATVVAPRLKLADLKGRALMIHAGGDNYSDNPKPLGGGGARIACGVVK